MLAMVPEVVGLCWSLLQRPQEEGDDRSADLTAAAVATMRAWLAGADSSEWGACVAPGQLQQWNAALLHRLADLTQASEAKVAQAATEVLVRSGCSLSARTLSLCGPCPVVRWHLIRIGGDCCHGPGFAGRGLFPRSGLARPGARLGGGTGGRWQVAGGEGFWRPGVRERGTVPGDGLRCHRGEGSRGESTSALSLPDATGVTFACVPAHAWAAA